MSALDYALSPDLILRDHFYSNDSVADAAVGELNWELVTIGNAPTLSLLATTSLDTSSIGVLRHTTAATANGDGGVMRLFTDGLVVNPGTAIKFRVRYPNVTGNQLAGNDWRIGLQDSVTATAPTVGVLFFSDAGVLNCRVDSADSADESVAVTGHADLTSGTTMVLGDWTTFEIRCSGEANSVGGPDEVDFYVNGSHVAKIPTGLDNDEEVELSIVHYQNSGAGASLELDIDYVFLYVPHPAGRSA